ncbi:MAG: Hsp20/alpha crystallin family protein [Verrucomicrobiota bacterium]
MTKTDSEVTQAARRESFRRPHYEVVPGKEKYLLKVHLPGVAKDRAEITIEKDQLLVVGRRKTQAPEGFKPVYEELARDDYRLQLQLNVQVDQDRVEAQTENGVLTVTLPLAAASKAKTISVE